MSLKTAFLGPAQCASNGQSTQGFRASHASCDNLDNHPARKPPPQCLDGQGLRVACITAVPPDYFDLAPGEYENPSLDCEGKYDANCTYCEMVGQGAYEPAGPPGSGGIAPVLADGDYAPPPDSTGPTFPVCLSCPLGEDLDNYNECGEAHGRPPRSSCVADKAVLSSECCCAKLLIVLWCKGPAIVK